MLYEGFEYKAFGIYLTKPTRIPVSMSSHVYFYVKLLHLLIFVNGFEVATA